MEGQLYHTGGDTEIASEGDRKGGEMRKRALREDREQKCTSTERAQREDREQKCTSTERAQREDKEQKGTSRVKGPERR